MPKRIPTADELIPAPSTLPPPETVAPVSLADEQRAALRDAMVALTIQIQETWDAEDALETILGFDVDGLTGWFADHAVAGPPAFSDEDLDDFLRWARSKQDGPDHDPDDAEDTPLDEEPR